MIFEKNLVNLTLDCIQQKQVMAQIHRLVQRS